MPRLRRGGQACPDRSAALLAALAAAAAVPLDYDGQTPTAESLAALVAAGNRVHELDQAPCTSPQRRGNYCDVCMGRVLAGYAWMLAHEAHLPALTRRALAQARLSGWPGAFLSHPVP